MAFEIKSADRGPVYEGGDLVAVHFPDDEWWNLLSLAHECGFDPTEEYVSLVYPDNVDEIYELDGKLASGLYIGASAVVNQDTLPFATTWESDDRLHFRWVYTLRYARHHEPQNSRNSRANSDFSLNATELQRLLKYLGKGPVLVTRIEDQVTT